MSINLIGLLKDQISGDLVSKVAGFLGENPAKTTSAVGSALPSILAGLVQKSSDSQGASSIFNMLSSGNHDGSILNNLSGLLGGGSSTNNLVSAGTSLLSSLFGDKVGGIANIIANVSGLSKNSSSSLLGMLAPIVMGMIGKTVKSQGITSASGLASLLGGQADFLKGALPAGLGSLMGFTNLGELGSKAASAAAGAASDAGGGIKKLAPWLLLAGAALVGWMMMRSCNKEEVKVPQAVQEAPQKAIEAVSNLFEKALSTGFKISAPRDGIEGQLVAFIEDANRPVDKTTWFNFDRLLFETGKATLKPESQEQLKNVAEIMKAFPAVEIKIGGYTDNTGNPASNMKLSADRANATMAELVTLGVEAPRMKAEGYGDQHPVASNDTEEGRAQNRRIALRVTKK